MRVNENVQYAALVLLGASLVVLSGCQAVYYYETEKLSLALQTTPDATAPVTGNLGLKQKIVLVVPPTSDPKPQSRENNQKNPDLYAADQRFSSLEGRIASLEVAAAAPHSQDKYTAEFKREVPGNALSVISSFRFSKEPGIVTTPKVAETGGQQSIIEKLEAKNGVVTIDAAFITGEAARRVAANGKIERAIEAISAEPDRQRYDVAILRTQFDRLKSVQSTDLHHADADELRSRLNLLVKLLPNAYPATFYDKDVNQTLHSKGDPVKRIGKDGFDDVLDYWIDLNYTVTALEKATAADPSNTDRAKELKSVRGMRDAFVSAVNQSPSVQSLMKVRY